MKAFLWCEKPMEEIRYGLFFPGECLRGELSIHSNTHPRCSMLFTDWKIRRIWGEDVVFGDMSLLDDLRV